MSRRRVVILHGAVPPEAPPDEQDVLVEVDAVAGALERLGYEPEALPMTLDLQTARARLAAAAPERVFNLVESVDGRGALIHLGPALLEDLGLSYTGAPLRAMFLSSHKPLAKSWLQAHGIPVPPGAGDWPGPWIVKSAWEHASIGMDDSAVVRRREDLPAVLEARRARLGGEWFAEAYIDGREFNLALLAGPGGPVCLPAAEILFQGYPADKPRIVGYAAKWDPGAYEYQHTPRRFHRDGADAPLELLRALALRCWQIFELRGYARVDFRLDSQGRPWVLEVNANPCLAPDAGFAAALAEAGLDVDAAVARILDDVAPPGA